MSDSAMSDSAMSDATHDVTRLLQAWSAGDTRAGEMLMPRVYEALRAVAGRAVRRRRHDTLQPTALVNEAYLRLRGQRKPWRNRRHFFALAATMMRRVLIDHARHAGRVKRGGDALRVDVAGAHDVAADSVSPDEIMAFEESIRALGSIDPRKADVVTLRVLVGLSIDEVAEALETSPATVNRDWRFARAWLANRLRSGEPGSSATIHGG